MQQITSFTLAHSQNSLIISFADQTYTQLSYEYLRVFSQWQPQLKQQAKSTAPPSHKKAVILMRVESVAEHGFRFCFDDGFNTVLNVAQLQALAQTYQDNWPLYLATMKAQRLNREANINIQQL